MSRKQIFTLRLLTLLTALGLSASSAHGALLVGSIELDGNPVSGPDGQASVPAGDAYTVSISLVLDPMEEVSSFEGFFDLSVVGLSFSPLEVDVMVDWTSVTENTTGSQSAWSDRSDPASGMRLVARWLVDTAGSAQGDLFEVVLAVGTFTGKDLDEDPFFELIPIDTEAGTVLAGVSIVPEASTGVLVGLGLVGLSLASSGRRAQRPLARHCRLLA